MFFSRNHFLLSRYLNWALVVLRENNSEIIIFILESIFFYLASATRLTSIYKLIFYILNPLMKKQNKWANAFKKRYFGFCLCLWYIFLGYLKSFHSSISCVAGRFWNLLKNLERFWWLQACRIARKKDMCKVFPKAEQYV